MWAKIMSSAPEGSYYVFERFIPVKIPGKEKRRVDIRLLQNIRDIKSAIGKFIAGEHQCYLPVSAVSPGDSALIIRKLFRVEFNRVAGQRFFLAGAVPLSFAAIK